MADKPVWIDYADVAAKLLLPVVIFWATQVYNDQAELRRSAEQKAQARAAALQAQADARDKAQQSCIDLQIKLVSVSCEGKSCTETPERQNQVLTVGQLLRAMCDRAGLKPAEPVNAAVLTASLASHDVGASAAGQQAAGRPAPRVSVAAANTTSGPSVATTAASSGAGGPRVFIQIADEAQRGDAKTVQARLAASTFNGRSLAAPGVELVGAAKAPPHTELRCFKAADCAVAGQLAAYIGGFVGRTILVRDLHARYEADAAVKPGTYELWFGPGAVLDSGSTGGGF